MTRAAARFVHGVTATKKDYEVASEPNEEWISPRESVNLLSPLVGGDAAAKALLADRLRDGVLLATAGFMAESADVGAIAHVVTDRERQRQMIKFASDGAEIEIDSNFPQVSETHVGTRFACWIDNPGMKRVIVGGAFWGASFDWQKDLGRWQWGEGTFVASCPAAIQGKQNPPDVPLSACFPKRLVAYGVEFQRSEIQKIVDSFLPYQLNKNTNQSNPPKSPQRRVAKFDWEAMLLELVALSHVKGLDEHFNKKSELSGWQQSLEKWILDYFSDRDVEVGESAARDHARQIVKAMDRRRGEAA